MYKTLKRVFKRSLWTMLTVFFAILFAIALVGGNIADGFQAAINGFLGTNPYKRVTVGETNGPDTDYYKSEFTKKDADGNTIYEKDENGVWHAVYDDEAMRKNSQEVALQAAVEGSVLLWNKNNALPLAADSRVSMFGMSSVNYVFLGDGSGGMSVTPPEQFRTVFPKYGLQYNSALYMAYTGLINSYKRGWRNPNEAPWSAIESAVNQSVTPDDTAVMIISRVAGEQSDILPTNADTFVDPGNYLDITQDEKEILDKLIEMRKANKLSKVVLLINSANAMQFAHLKDLDVDACVLVGQSGTMSYEQIAAALSGKGDYVVSGKLADAYLYNNNSAPANVNFGDHSWTESPLIDSNPKNHAYMTNNDKYIVYQEGVYVGYRYFETRYEDSVLGTGNAIGSAGVKNSKGDWKYEQEVAYPFGYGGSYAQFEYSDYKVERNANGVDYDVSLAVKNKSSSEYDGKEVLQVYLQKPYTDYDKAHGIEKPSVELVGFAKTKRLEPGESTTLTVTVKEEEFRTYDADSARSYIFEEGDYYLAFGTNSHDALNNILAAKGKTTEHGMDYNGNAEFAHRITVDKNYKGYKTDKFKTSSHTGVEITNRFDDADLNRYDGTKDDQSIVYLSRNDWQGTYPTAAVSLKCVDERMIEDMMYGHPVEVKDGDNMPKYNEVTSSIGQLNIAMLMDVEYGDDLWNDLLNQMTVKEQQFLISYGLNHVAGAQSVDAPGMESRDGPAGVKANNPTLKTTFSFPSETVLAATFDTELVEKVGKAFGMEILHAGLTVIYGPGGCIHRSAYSGRNWEYFSEDGVLSGKMLAAEVKGLQKYGVVVETKHFALNDTETNRYGVATFANEQTMRDVYLRAFEIAVDEGKMNGVMSSFNRIGCTWSGAHKGLLTDVLRNEWGFNGIVETDSCTGSTGKYVRHMCSIHAKAEGLLAGNDIWMCASGSEEFMIDHASDHEDFEQSPPAGTITADDKFDNVSYLDNATVMLALRESCHRLLYAQLHSNAMNGMDASTRVYKVKVWWQTLIEALTITFGILMGIFALMAIASFIINTAWFKEKLRASRAAAAERKAQNAAGGGAPSGNAFTRFFVNIGVKFKALDKTKKIIVIVCACVAVIAIVLAIILPITLTGGKGGNSGVTPLPPKHVCGHVCPECGLCLDADCQDPVCENKCPGHPHECTSICPICEKCYDLDCTEEVCAEKCGHDKKSYLFEAENAELSDGKNQLKISTSGDVTFVGEVNQNFGAQIKFTILSQEDTTASLIVRVSRRAMDTVFTDMMMTSVNGNEIASKSVVKAPDDGKEGWWSFIDVNLGCVNLKKGANTVMFMVASSGNYSGYNFDRIELKCDSELSVYVPHKCEQKCAICGKCLDLDCEQDECKEKCEIAGLTEYKAEAEDAELKDGISKVTTKQAGDKTVVTGLNRNNGASVSFTVYVEHDTTVKAVAALSKRIDKVKLSDVFDITVGNTAYTTNAIAPASGDGVADMSEFADINLGCMRLKAGKNIVTFAVKNNNDIGFDFDYVKFFASEVLSFVKPDWYIETDEYKFEAENAELDKGSKGMPYKGETARAAIVSNLSGNAGAKVKFNVYSEFNVKADLTVAFVPLKSDTKITDIFDITVNGTLITSDAVIKGYGEITTQNAVEALLGEINLHDGTDNAPNVIEFTVKTGTNGFNIFDYITLETVDCELSAEYMAPTPDGHTHTYSSDWTYNDEYHWHAGNCDHTFKKKDYAKHEFDVNNVCVDCGYTRSFKFEAEWVKWKDGSSSYKMSIQGGASGSVLGNTNNNGNGLIMFAVYSPKISTQKMYMSVNRKAKATKNDDGTTTYSPLKISDGWQLFVNKQEFMFDDSTAIVPMPASGGVDWHAYDEVLLGEVSLKQGMNYFMFKIKPVSESAENIDYFRFQGDALLSAVNTYDGAANIYEGELADLEGGIYIGGDCTTKDGGLISPELDGINNSTGRSIKYSIHSNTPCKVKLVAAVTIRDKDIKMNSVFEILVNSVKMTIDDSVLSPKDTANNWFKSEEVEIGEIDLVAGQNTITFTTIGKDSFNFDYIKLIPAE